MHPRVAACSPAHIIARETHSFGGGEGREAVSMCSDCKGLGREGCELRSVWFPLATQFLRACKEPRAAPLLSKAIQVSAVLARRLSNTFIRPCARSKRTQPAQGER